jgi:hypothetical protein
MVSADHPGAEKAWPSRQTHWTRSKSHRNRRPARVNAALRSSLPLRLQQAYPSGR